jgi:hypothetical protein
MAVTRKTLHLSKISEFQLGNYETKGNYTGKLVVTCCNYSGNFCKKKITLEIHVEKRHITLG